MALHRLTSLTLGVPDVDASSKFFVDFGLEPGENGWHSTRDGGDQLELVQTPHRQLQRVGVGATSPDDLAAIAHRVESVGLGSIVESSDTKLVLSEPVTGLTVDVTIAERLPAVAHVPPVNSPGSTHRIDVPAPSVLSGEAARPSNLTHVVYGSPDLPTTLRFFTDVVGFEVSDEVPGIIAFTRCGVLHHNLALQAAPVAFVHHIAFEVDGIDDVVRRGQHMVEIDPQRHTWGLGRHAIGSNWFWYLRDPSGTFIEYAADIDRVSAQDQYQPKEWSPKETLSSFGPPVPREFIAPPDLADLIAASGG